MQTCKQACFHPSQSVTGWPNIGRLPGEIMNHGDRKQIIAEDGSVYEVEAIHIPNGIFTHALVVNEEMRAKASRLLPIAQRMAESKATRATFTVHQNEVLRFQGRARTYKLKTQLVSRGIAWRSFFWWQRVCLLKASGSLL